MASFLPLDRETSQRSFDVSVAEMPKHHNQKIPIIERMLNRRTTYLLLISIIALLAVACSSADTDLADVTEVPPATEVIEQTSEPLATNVPLATARARATVTPIPEPEGTEVPESESVTFYLQGFNSLGRGEYVDAERTFTTVVELEPAFARGWDGRGQAFMLQGKYEEAMLDFDRAIELKPNLSVAYANRSLTRLAIDDLEGAERDARRTYELDDESVAAHLVLGRVEANKGDPDSALEWFDLAVVSDPEDASTWWWRGRFYRDVLAAGNPALEDFNKAIELAPAQAALYLDRAQLYIQAEVEADLARADLEEAISLSKDPKLPSIIARAEDLIAELDANAAAAQ
ncbi:MAG: tetratricopeptide repeat protein [Chloroflexi bacterium]|nr:tetratricopeptide repeat protein [Chloroflexota bacterium]